MVHEEKIEGLQIENERLKKDISELEIMHRAEIEALKKENAESKSVESIEKTFGDFVFGKTPMEVALKLINAKVWIPGHTTFGIKYEGCYSEVFDIEQLREIAEYLTVYCMYNKEEQ